MVPAIFTLLRLCPRTFAPASYLLPLSLSLCYFRPISLPRPPPRGAIHILGIQKGKGESNKREKRKEKDGGNLPTSRIALISHPCEIASAAHLPDDWQPLFLSFSHLLYPPSILLLTTYVCCASLLSPPRFFKIGRPDEIRSSPLLSCVSLSLSLFFCRWERERSLSDSPSLGERPIPLEDPLPPRQKFRADAREKRREERKKAKCRFRTILERSISYERCRSPLAYKTFIKSPTKWTGGRRRRCTRGKQAAAGCQMILKLFGTVSTANHPSSIRSHHQPPLLESFRTPMAAWPG